MATAPKDISDCLKELTVSSTEIHESVVGKEIGRGAYSRVFIVKYGFELCAAKAIHSFLVEGVEQQLIRERFLQHCSVLNHRNIVRFVDINFNMNSTVMIMELMDWNLYDHIKDLPEHKCFRSSRYILQDVAEGLVYLHKQKPAVFHGDLSPRNILLETHDGEAIVAKIGDLGVAKIIKADSKATQSMLTQVPGSVDFMPPESFGDSPVYGTPTDTFSYGCIMLFVFSHEWPTPSVKAKFDPVTKKNVTYSEVERRQQYLNKITFEARRLEKTIKSCLSDNPSERPTMAAVAKAVAEDEAVGEYITLFIKTDHIKRKSTYILIREDSTVCNLLSRVSEKLKIPVSPFSQLYILFGKMRLFCSTETLKDYGIENNSSLYVGQYVIGGGGAPLLYTYIDDCLLKHECPFHDLFKWDDIYELSQKQENAYKLLCCKFNLSDEVIRAIEDNNEAKDIRLADVLHRIYHKDRTITLQRINLQFL